ncbi:MAG: fibronectin type III domain-containing protein, partial [Eubacteriales bacterium]
ESLELITSDMDEWTDYIRFGNRALKLNYDFSNVNGIEGACVGFSKAIELTGSPSGIGVWIYAPEGTTNLWLRAAVGVETAPGSGVFSYTYVNFTTRCDTAQMADKSDFGGINWEGWKYVEADLSMYAGRTIRILPGETIRVMYTNGNYGTTNAAGQKGGMGNFTKDGTYVPKAEAKGWILIDNLQFVYGVNNQDITPPDISDIYWSDGEDGVKHALTDGTVITDAGDVTFWFYFNDNEYTDRYATGVVTELFYIDDMLAGGGSLVQQEGYAFLPRQLSNGPHSLTCYAKDGFGNVTRKTVYFTVDYADASDNYPSLGFTYGEEVYLGETFDLSFTSTYKNLSNISAINASININKNYSVADVIFHPAFEGSYTFENGTLTLSGHLKEGATYSDEDDTLFTVRIAVPTTLSAGANLDFRVLNAIITLHECDITGIHSKQVTWTASLPTVYLPVSARYTLLSDVLIAGHECTLRVIDEAGAPAAGVGIYVGETQIGITDADGCLTTDAFAEVGTKTAYAKDEAGAVSFSVNMTTCATTGETAPYYILANATADPTTSQNITWLTNPDYAAAIAVMQVSTSADMSDAVTFTGKTVPLAYAVTGTANYSNSVTATGLEPGTTYYFRVGDGDTWSSVGTFTTADTEDRATEFFIIGDMQGEDAAMAGIFSDILSKEGVDYDFGVQLGDAVDNVAKYNEWQGALNIFSSGIYAATDMIHVIGNHETFGDETALAARSIFGSPADDASGYYSVEYGHVYVAVIGYTLDPDAMQASLDWLAEDAAKSTCPWKILVLHVPVYNTNAEQTDSLFYNQKLPAVAEAAGIQFVFSGHDHSYARTDSKNGVYYYISGTAGEKKYSCSDNGFNFVKMTQDYGAIYLTAYATDHFFGIYTYDVDEKGNATLIDSVELTTGICETHTYVYDEKTGD